MTSKIIDISPSKEFAETCVEVNNALGTRLDLVANKEPIVDLTKGCMHTSHTMGACIKCQSPTTLMITGVIGRDLIAQHKCGACDLTVTYRKPLEAWDMPVAWGEELRMFQRSYKQYQVWPPIVKQKEIDYAVKLEGEEDNESDGEAVRKDQGKKGILCEFKRRED